MNVANLQIEGLVMAMAYTNHLLVKKGVLSLNEIDIALRKAEANLSGEERFSQHLDPSNRDAVCFPLRMLQAANLSADEEHTLSFSELARITGENKKPYNDQR